MPKSEYIARSLKRLTSKLQHSWYVCRFLWDTHAFPVHCHIPLSCYNTDLWPLQHVTVHCSDRCFMRPLNSVFSEQWPSSEPFFWWEMGLVRIRHGVAQHAMKSRVRAYKIRAKGSGWQANWREHFCHSLTLKTSVFPLWIRFLSGPITSSTTKKSTSVADLDSNQEVDGGAKACTCRMLEWWSSGKKGSPHRFIALWKHIRCSLRTLSNSNSDSNRLN